MKHLQDYIVEQAQVNEAKSETITFDFEGLENAEDTVKSLEDVEGVEIDGNKVTVTISQDNADKLGKLQDIVQQFYDTCHSSSKRTNDPQYAELVKTFGETVGKFNDALDKVQNPDDGDDKDDKKDKKEGEDE